TRAQHTRQPLNLDQRVRSEDVRLVNDEDCRARPGTDAVECRARTFGEGLAALEARKAERVREGAPYLARLDPAVDRPADEDAVVGQRLPERVDEHRLAGAGASDEDGKPLSGEHRRTEIVEGACVLPVPPEEGGVRGEPEGVARRGVNHEESA